MPHYLVRTKTTGLLLGVCAAESEDALRRDFGGGAGSLDIVAVPDPAGLAEVLRRHLRDVDERDFAEVVAQWAEVVDSADELEGWLVSGRTDPTVVAGLRTMGVRPPIRSS